MSLSEKKKKKITEKKAKVKYSERQEKLRKEELALKYIERIFVQACGDLRTW